MARFAFPMILQTARSRSARDGYGQAIVVDRAKNASGIVLQRGPTSKATLRAEASKTLAINHAPVRGSIRFGSNFRTTFSRAVHDATTTTDARGRYNF